ncbi:MAG: energy-coupling factor transporter transmembrane component T, partial [Clostridia bacterium]
MKNIHPLAVFIYFIVTAVIAAALPDPGIIAAALLTGGLFAALSGVKKLWIYGAVIIGVGVINPLFFHRGETVLFFINNSPVTLESLLCGLNNGAMIGAVMLWFAAYNRVMNTEKHLYLFGRFTPRLGIMVSMALRFAPLFVKKYREISAAQKA